MMAIMRKTHLLASVAFLALSTFSAAAAAKPKPGKCAVASAGVAAEDVASPGWGLVATGLVAAAFVRRARR
jgi:hypothetical protein